MKSFSIIILVSLGYVQSLLAIEPQAKKLTITGTHIPDASDSLAKITITAEEIAALAPNSFADVLRGLPGIDIKQQGGIGGLTFLSIRGGDPNFVVILIDGVKVNDPTNSRGGAFDLGTLDPALIEQVDIFYGSFSSQFGSDALAGVISIQTKGAVDGQLGRASLKFGSNNSKGSTFHLAGNITEATEVSLLASYQDGDDSTFGDAFNRKELIASIKSIDDTFNWNLGFFYADGQSQTFPEDSGGERLAVIRDPEIRDFIQTNLNARTTYWINEAFSFDFQAAFSEREEDISNPGIAPGVLDSVPAITSESNYQLFDMTATAAYRFSNQFSGAIGVAIADEEGGMQSIIDFGFPVPATYTLKRQTKSVFAETTFNPSEQLNVIASLRSDRAEQINVTTGRLIGRYQMSRNNRLSLQYSEGFKLASFFALGHPLVGNPDLKSERSENIELSFDNRSIEQKISSGISIYQNTFSGLVDFDPQNFTHINRSKVRAQGVEVDVALIASQQFELSGQITYNKMETFEIDTKLRRRPKWKASLQMNYQPVDELSLTARITYDDHFFDSSIATGRVTIDSFSRLDMSAVWRFANDLNFRINASNVLNDHSEQAIGFNNVGRSLTVSLLKSF